MQAPALTRPCVWKAPSCTGGASRLTSTLTMMAATQLKMSVGQPMHGKCSGASDELSAWGARSINVATSIHGDVGLHQIDFRGAIFLISHARHARSVRDPAEAKRLAPSFPKTWSVRSVRALVGGALILPLREKPLEAPSCGAAVAASASGPPRLRSGVSWGPGGRRVVSARCLCLASPAGPRPDRLKNSRARLARA